MSSDKEQTIIQQIQPYCEALYRKMKHEKDVQGKTNRSVARHTGVSESSVANFFSGAASKPCVYDTAAICIHLGLSLDELMGISAPSSIKDENIARIEALETQLNHAKSELELVKHHSKYLETGLSERKPVIYGLTALCLLLAVSLVSYVAMDVSNGNFGFFTDNRISAFGIVIVIILLVSIGVLTAHFINGLKEKKKDQANKKSEKD